MSTRKRQRRSESKRRTEAQNQDESFVPVRVSLFEVRQSESENVSPTAQEANQPDISSEENTALDYDHEDQGEVYTDTLIQNLMSSTACCSDQTEVMSRMQSLNNDQEFEEMWQEAREQLIGEDEIFSKTEFDECFVEEEWVEVEEVLQYCSSMDQQFGQRSTESNEDAQENSQEDDNDLDKTPLYGGSSVTLGSIMVLIALFVIKHNLSGEAIEHFLSIFAAALPISNVLPRTISRFRKYFCHLRNPFIIHKYCTFCLAYVGERDLVNCPNTHCLKDLTRKGGTAYFIEIPIIKQIQTLFSRDGFFDDLQHRFHRKKKNINNLEDVYDGRIYRRLVKDGILQSGNNFSFVFNTDGVPIFKSSKVSIWPIYLVINELPYKKRMATENMLLSGLWFGEKKPAMWSFLKPFYKSFVDLEQGVIFQVKNKGPVTCKAVLLGCTCDLPARCMICNAMQFNGASSCWKCLQEGKTAKVSQRGHTRVFPFMHHDPKGPQRTFDDTLMHAKDALQNQMSGKTNQYAVHGIKGLSWLALIPRFNYVAGVGIDYMHGVLLGVQKTLLKLWFNATFSGRHFSVRSLISKADARLSEIAPTLEIKRMPRSIEEHLQYWKANELRSFLLYFGIPVLYGILPDEYFQHYFLLVHAVYFLLKDSISSADLSEAEKLLFMFCEKLSSLYGEQFMTLNFHQLVHLADDVRDLGPLYTHSCFSFEDKNGFILKLIHGTQFIESQILTAVSFVQKIPELREKCIKPGSEVEEIYRSLSCARRPKNPQLISSSLNAYRLGSIYVQSLDELEYAALERYLGYPPATVNVTAFNRISMFQDSRHIYSTRYKKMYKRNCSTVKYCKQGSFHFAQVEYFFRLSDCPDAGQTSNLVMARPLALQKPYSCRTHINVVERPNLSIFVTFALAEICSNVLYLQFTDEPDRAYVCEFPNFLEVD